MAALLKPPLGYKLALLAILAVLLSLAPCVPVFADEEAEHLDKQIENQEEEYQRLQKQIAANSEKLSEAQKKEKNVARDLEALSRKISVTEKRVGLISLKMKKVRNNVAGIDKEIKATDKDIKYAKELLSHRIVTIYKYGGVTEFNLLLSSQCAQDALTNSYLLGKIAEQDQKLINSLENDLRKMNEAQKKLESERKTLKTQGEDLARQKRALGTAFGERNEAMAQVRRDKKAYMDREAELQKASRELQATIKRLLAEKRAAMKKKPESGKPAPVYYSGGRLAWPLHGRVTSTYGTRIHPVFKTKSKHTGLDISAPKGTPVKAAAAGEVLFAGWLRGYGKVVMLDHGGNLVTVYAHLSSIECAEGAVAAKLACIGRVGSTGMATGNHLHFEVRENGDDVDPMKYLR